MYKVMVAALVRGKLVRERKWQSGKTCDFELWLWSNKVTRRAIMIDKTPFNTFLLSTFVGLFCVFSQVFLVLRLSQVLRFWLVIMEQQSDKICDYWSDKVARFVIIAVTKWQDLRFWLVIMKRQSDKTLLNRFLLRTFVGLFCIFL